MDVNDICEWMCECGCVIIEYMSARAELPIGQHGTAGLATPLSPQPPTPSLGHIYSQIAKMAHKCPIYNFVWRKYYYFALKLFCFALIII